MPHIFGHVLFTLRNRRGRSELVADEDAHDGMRRQLVAPWVDVIRLNSAAASVIFVFFPSVGELRVSLSPLPKKERPRRGLPFA